MLIVGTILFIIMILMVFTFAVSLILSLLLRRKFLNPILYLAQTASKITTSHDYSLRAEQHHNNIAVTLVCPGFVNTNVSKNALTGNGSPQDKMDVATQNGISPERFSKLMIKAIQKKKEEVYIAGAKEKLAVYVKRFFPKLLSIMIRKLSVT